MLEMISQCDGGEMISQCDVGEMISQCDVSHIMTLQIKTITVVLKVSNDLQFHQYHSSSHQTRYDNSDNVCLGLHN
jgi:hypothetical protein